MDIRERIANAKSPEGDFMPQFEKAEEYLLNLCRKFRDMIMDQRPDTDGVETAAKDLEPVNV